MDSKCQWTENNLFFMRCFCDRLFVYKVTGGAEEGKLIKASVCSYRAGGPSNEMLSAVHNREASVCEQL